MTKQLKIALVSLFTLSLLIPIAFTVTQYTLYVANLGDGSITLNPGGEFTGWDEASYDEGTVVEITANPDPGWEFIGWDWSLYGEPNPTTITMDDDYYAAACFSYIDRPYKYKAWGLLEYYDDPDVATEAEIVSGSWKFTVKGDSYDFNAILLERNLDEEVEQSPEGSIDKFWIKLVDTHIVQYYPDGAFEIYGDFDITKRWKTLPDNPDGYPIVWRHFVIDGWMRVDSENCVLWIFPDATGRTLKIMK